MWFKQEKVVEWDLNNKMIRIWCDVVKRTIGHVQPRDLTFNRLEQGYESPTNAG